MKKEIFFSSYDETLYGLKRHVLIEKLSQKYIERIGKKLRIILVEQLIKCGEKIAEKSRQGSGNHIILSPYVASLFRNNNEMDEGSDRKM